MKRPDVELVFVRNNIGNPENESFTVDAFQFDSGKKQDRVFLFHFALTILFPKLDIISLAFLQFTRCTIMGLLGVIRPMISSPGMGLQQGATLYSRSVLSLSNTSSGLLRIRSARPSIAGLFSGLLLENGFKEVNHWLFRASGSRL